MQNEKDFPNHCKNFLHNQDFKKLFKKIDDDTSVFEISDSNLCLYIVDEIKFLLLVYLYD